MTALQKAATNATATMPPQSAIILSRDLSPWKTEQLYAVNREVADADNLMLNGRYHSMVFEGPYKNAKKWYDSLCQAPNIMDTLS